MQERELIKKSIAGDKEAMDRLVKLHWERVYRHCLKILGDVELAEDAAQESFVKAFEHLENFQKRATFSTWIWRIAHNTSLNILRKERRADLPLQEELLAAPSSTDWGDLLDQLDEKHRRVFELFVIEKMPQKEIAKLLKIPHGTVRSRVHYARLKLKKSEG